MSDDTTKALKCHIEKATDNQKEEDLLNSVSQIVKTDKVEKSFLYIYRKKENIISQINKKLAGTNPIALIRSQRTGSQTDV